jgi:filamentous hemagglutinin
MSARAAAYQTQITGMTTDQAYVVNGVKFDGFSNNVLLDAKGPGYANFLDSEGEWQSWAQTPTKLLNQAGNQISAANGVPVVWHVAEPEATTAIQDLLQSNGVKGITVIHTPPVGP